MSDVLIVDDNPIDRRLAAAVLEKGGMETQFAGNGKEALERLSETKIDLVLTDMQMPEMDGLELVEQIKADFPATPVILMTAHGSEELAVKALQIGASSYTPKHNLQRDLVETVRDVLSVAHVQEAQRRMMETMTLARWEFEFGPAANHEPFINHAQEQLQSWGLCDEMDLIRIGTALHEALVNATEHGNLELDSKLRDDPDGAYHTLGEQRRQEAPYKDRMVRFTVQCTPEQIEFTICDEGPGFDPSSLPDPTDPENIGKISGRGLLLIRTFMDDVHFNETGNQITMIRRKAASETE